MGLTRKFLTGMGLTAEQVDAIIDEHANTVDSLKEQRDSYKEDADKLKDVTKELNDLKKKVEDGSDDAAGWKEKFENEHKAFEDFKKEEKSKETIREVRKAYTELLKENNVSEKHINSILNVTDFKEMKLAEDGTLADKDNLVKGIKEKWDGFITNTSTSGAGVETPPSGSKGTFNSKADIYAKDERGHYKLSTSERMQAVQDNPQLFN